MEKKKIDLTRLSESSVADTAQTIRGSGTDVPWTVRLAAGGKGGMKRSPRR